MFKKTEQFIGDVVVVEFSGAMTLAGGDVLYNETIERLLTAGRKKIVVDLTICATSTAPVLVSWSRR